MDFDAVPEPVGRPARGRCGLAEKASGADTEQINQEQARGDETALECVSHIR